MPTTPHLHILAEAAPMLASTDLDDALRGLGRLVVPEIADWCAIHLVDADGVIERVEVAHRDPERVAFALDLQRRFPPEPGASAVYEVMRTGQGVLIPQVTEEMLDAGNRDPEFAAMVASLRLHSAITVPLRARGRNHGALTLLTEEGGRVYDEKWLELAESVASLAALAVDNTRLYTELTRASARNGAILNGVPEGITVQSEDGRLVFANDAAARSMGLESAEALLETPVAEITSRFHVMDEHGTPLSPERLPGRRALAGESNPTALLCYRMQEDGPLRWSRMRATRLDDPLGGPPVAINVMQDLTAHIENEQKLEEAAATQASLARELEEILEQVRSEQEAAELARAQAEHANAAKTQFLAVVSHELRTPLNAISGFTELLSLEVSGTLTDAQRKHLSRIENSTRHLTSLIEQILTFSRIEAGHEDIGLEDVDVMAVIEGVAEMLEQMAADKRLEFPRATGDSPLLARADAARVRQILLNLIGNAIKFTDEGSVDVEAERSDDAILIRVRDSGSGIDGAQLERIFEPFTQVDASATRRVGGTGLGLAVSRHLARLMGGDILVTSEPGVGSEFTLSLPAADADSHRTGAAAPSA